MTSTDRELIEKKTHTQSFKVFYGVDIMYGSYYHRSQINAIAYKLIIIEVDRCSSK